MQFIDEVTINVAAGHGGPGAVSFRREKYEPRGGPDGGNGGRGGDILVIGDASLNTLLDYRYLKKYEARNGNPGSGSRSSGRDGESITLRLPLGTVIKDSITNEILFDVMEPNAPLLLCKGGRGGKGNAHFATSTRQAPRFSQTGEPGEAKELKLELKLLADVGIIGLPNVGKSSLISAISNARPRIADYPFTTLVPNLGVVGIDEFRSFVVADIPGLIPGAHQGKGLGTRFLKHIERTRLLVHMLDLSTGNDLENDYQQIREELGKFNPELTRKDELIVFNKKDAEADPNIRQKLEKKLMKEGKVFLTISVATRENLKELLNQLSRKVFF